MKLLCERVKAERAKQDEAEDRAKDSSNLTLNTWPHFSSPHSARRPSGFFLLFRPLRRFPSLLFHAPCDARPLCSSSFFLPSIPSCPCIPIPKFFHSSCGAGWRGKVVRSDDFSDTVSCPVVGGGHELEFGDTFGWSVWESVDGFEAEIFFFFLEITFLE